MKNYILFKTLLILISTTMHSSLLQAETKGQSAILANLAMGAGGASFGVDYEHSLQTKMGVGAMFRMHPDDDITGQPGVNVIGGFVRPHFRVKKWDFYMSPGFGIIMVKPPRNGDEETLFGPTLSYGLLYSFNKKMSFGVEDSTYYGWFGEDVYLRSYRPSVMAKFRFNF